MYDASGSVGTAAVPLARACETEVTGVSSPPNLEWVRSLGASRVVDYAREDFARANVFDAVGKLWSARGRDRLARDGVVLTVVPGPDVLLHGLWASLAGGQRGRFASTGSGPRAGRRKTCASSGG